jgi:hypothetical protein
MVSRILRYLVITIAVLSLIAVCLVWRIDRTPLEDQEFFSAMHKKLDTLQPEFSTAKRRLLSGWARVNITPSYPMPMAGYIPRDHFENVHDSLYARLLMVGNGDATIVFINVDLLLFPPLLRDALHKELGDHNYFLYLSATHTHNGVGGWDNSVVGKLVLGDFHGEWIEETAKAIAQGIRSIQVKPSTMGYWERDLSYCVENRINMESGDKDGIVRGIDLNRSDSSSAMLFTFSAHPTSIAKGDLSLSADYPGETINMLNDKVDFPMFMSGMVGSHRFNWLVEENDALLKKEATLLYDSIPGAMLMTTDSVVLRGAHVPIEFGPSQARIGKEWKMRDWLFRTVNRRLSGELTWVEIGNLVMIGTPCDFSGEIFVSENLGKMATDRNKHLMITSFNGDYVGYITDDRNYDSSLNEEVMALNWVGPYNGKYFASMIKKLIAK